MKRHPLAVRSSLSSFQGNALSVLGVVGGAFTLFSNVSDFIQLLDIVRQIVSEWREWLHTFWTYVFGWIGIKVHPFFVVPLTTILFFFQLAVGAHLTRIATHFLPGNWEFCPTSEACSLKTYAFIDYNEKFDKWIDERLLEVRIELRIPPGEEIPNRSAKVLELTKRFRQSNPAPQVNCLCIADLRQLSRNSELVRWEVSASQISDLTVYRRWHNDNGYKLLLWLAYITIISAAALASTKNSLYGSFVLDFVAVFVLMFFALYSVMLHVEVGVYTAFNSEVVLYRIYDRVLISVALLFSLVALNFFAITIENILKADGSLH